VDEAMRDRMATGRGFVAALDQSGGSTPKALGHYGVAEDAWDGDEEMFDLVHAMRTRVITSPSFDGSRILGAILFEDTMRRDVEGQPTATYLWQRKRIVPFLKVDRGLAASEDGVRVMKPIDDLDDLLAAATEAGVFGTKMRSVVEHDDATGVDRIVAQQFEVGERILDAGLVPILEPEVDIHSPTKADAEERLHAAIRARLDDLPAERQVMLKLTIPSTDGFYDDLIAHPRVLRVVALSGGYSRQDANERLARNPGLIASFSRALLEGLTADLDDDAFDATLAASVESIYDASVT
jgi:fructose-bisphosphate aldolase class I